MGIRGKRYKGLGQQGRVKRILARSGEGRKEQTVQSMEQVYQRNREKKKGEEKRDQNQVVGQLCIRQSGLGRKKVEVAKAGTAP